MQLVPFFNCFLHSKWQLSKGISPPPQKKIGCMAPFPHYTPESLPLRLPQLSADWTKEQVTLVSESFWRRAEFLSTPSGWIVSVEHTNKWKFWRHSLRHPIKTSFLFLSLSSPTASLASCGVGGGEGLNVYKLDLLLLLFSFRLVYNV